MKRKNQYNAPKPRKFKAGDYFLLPDGESIEIVKVYPKGHFMASEEQNWYLIKSSKIGQDDWPESQLKAETVSAKLIKH